MGTYTEQPSPAARAERQRSVFQIMPKPSTGTFDAVMDPLSYGVITQTPSPPFTRSWARAAGLNGPLVQGLNGRLYGESLDGGQLADGSGAGGTVYAIDAGLPYINSVTTPGGASAIPVTATSIMVHGVNLVGAPPYRHCERPGGDSDGAELH